MNIDNIANLSEALFNLIKDIFNAIYTTIIDTSTASATAATESDMQAFKVSMIVIAIMVLLLIYAQHGGKKAKK